MILNSGTLDRHDGPASTKCLSASPTPSLYPSSSCVLLTLDCLPWFVSMTEGTAVSPSLPFRSHSSAPLVTNVENRLNCFPPRRLLLKLGNHSPVVCGTSGGIMGNNSVCFFGELRGVIDEADPSFLLAYRECVGVTFKSGACAKSAVN